MNGNWVELNPIEHEIRFKAEYDHFGAKIVRENE